MNKEDKCWNCGNTEDLDYSNETGEINSEYEFIETYGFECPNCHEFTEIESRNVLI